MSEFEDNEFQDRLLDKTTADTALSHEEEKFRSEPHIWRLPHASNFVFMCI